MIWHPEQAPYLNLLQMLSWGAIAGALYWAALKLLARFRCETDGEAFIRLCRRVRYDEPPRKKALK